MLFDEMLAAFGVLLCAPRPGLGCKKLDKPDIDVFEAVRTSASPICDASFMLDDEVDQPPEPELLELIPIPCAHLRPIFSTARLARPAAAGPTPADMLIAVCRKDDGAADACGWCEAADGSRS